VDPLTREGIHYAIASAELLTSTLARGKPEMYGDLWDEIQGGELGWAARHRAMFYSQQFVEGFTLLASASPAVQGVISDLMAGRQSYRSLKRRLAACAPSATASLALRLLEKLLTGRPPLPPPALTPLAG
jgi:flavin-dependent dehydrogenase